MRKPMLAAACVLLFGIAGCGAGSAQNAISESSSVADSASSAQARSEVVEEQPFGNRHQFAGGLAVTVSEPRSFTPSPSAFPKADRAVAFDITIRNDSDVPFQLSGMSVLAAVNGTNIRELVDPERGLSGIVDAGADVAPGRAVQVTVAFAVTDDPATLYLTVLPDPAEPAVARYLGEA